MLQAQPESTLDTQRKLSNIKGRDERYIRNEDEKQFYKSS